MAGLVLEGYKLVNGHWEALPEGNLVLSEPKGTEEPLIIHNGLRIFIHQVFTVKGKPVWVRATLNPDKPTELQWSVLNTRGSSAHWQPVFPNEKDLLTSLNQIPGIAVQLSEAAQIKLQEQTDQNASQSDPFAAVRWAMEPVLQHIVDKPESISDDQWQMILKAALFPHTSRTELEAIQKNIALMKAYQGIAKYLLVENFGIYKFSDNIDLPTVGKIYNFTASYLFEQLKNKTDSISPVMTDTVLANQKINEIIKTERIVYMGLDDLQTNTMNTLLNMFNHFVESDENSSYQIPLDFFNTSSLQEMKALIEIISKQNILMPPDDWHAEIWNDFISCACAQAESYEDFAANLAHFNNENRNVIPTIKHNYDLMQEQIKALNSIDNTSFMKRLICVSPSGVGVLKSLSRDEYMELVETPNLFLGSRDTIQKLLMNIRHSIPLSLTDQFFSSDGIIELINHLLLDLIDNRRIKEFFNYIIELSPADLGHSLMTQNEILQALNETHPQGTSIEQFLVQLRDASFQLFTQCLTDEKFLKAILPKRNINKFALLNELKPKDRLAFISSGTVFKSFTMPSRDLVLAILPYLPEKDRIKFLSTEHMISLKLTNRSTAILLKNLIKLLPASDQKKLGETSEGQTVLASLIYNFFDFIYAISLVPDNQIINFSLTVAVHHPVVDRYPIINIYTALPSQMGKKFITAWFESTKALNPIDRKNFFYNPIVIDQLKTFKGSSDQLLEALLQVSQEMSSHSSSYTRQYQPIKGMNVDSDFYENVLKKVFDDHELQALTAPNPPKNTQK